MIVPQQTQEQTTRIYVDLILSDTCPKCAKNTPSAEAPNDPNEPPIPRYLKAEKDATNVSKRAVNSTVFSPSICPALAAATRARTATGEKFSAPKVDSDPVEFIAPLPSPEANFVSRHDAEEMSHDDICNVEFLPETEERRLLKRIASIPGCKVGVSNPSQDYKWGGWPDSDVRRTLTPH